MTARLVACTKCRAPLSPAAYNLPQMSRCSCGAQWQAAVFPAALRPPSQGSSAEQTQVEGEASCFYHPAKKAVVPCAGCGRFLCSVCDVEFAGEHLCPACLESGRRKGKLQRLETERTLYDTLALVVAVVPMVFMWPITCISAPIVVYLCIRYWKAPSSIIPRTKWRFVVALLIALLQIGGWAALLIAAFMG